jgi:hypothetical protein
VAVLTLGASLWQIKLAYDQGKLAREQAGMRPKLMVSKRETPFIWGRGQVRHADAVLHFEITNTGRTAAHNVGRA